jgi:hypothetical protein
MNRNTIIARQDEALSAYDRVSQDEAASWLQAAMLAEIAKQLEEQNEHLARITEQLDALATTAFQAKYSRHD